MPGSLRIALAALPLLALLAGCSSDNSSATPAGTTTSTVAPATMPITPAPGSGTTAAGSQPERLGTADVQATMVNNTVTGIAANGQTYFAWFGPTGQIRFAEGTIRDTGTWRTLPDGQFCSKMSRLHNGIEECYTLYRNGNVLTFDRPDGTPVGSFSVLPGNPQDL
jgi:hypothetical protein